MHKLCTNSKRIAMGLGALVAICYRRVPSICVPPSVRFFVPILVPFCVPVLGPFCVPVLGPFCVAVLGPFCVPVLGPICVPVLVRFGVPVLARLPSNFGAIWWRTSDRTWAGQAPGPYVFCSWIEKMSRTFRAENLVQSGGWKGEHLPKPVTPIWQYSNTWFCQIPVTWFGRILVTWFGQIPVTWFGPIW